MDIVFTLNSLFYQKKGERKVNDNMRTCACPLSFLREISLNKSIVLFFFSLPKIQECSSYFGAVFKTKICVLFLIVFNLKP